MIQFDEHIFQMGWNHHLEDFGHPQHQHVSESTFSCTVNREGEQLKPLKIYLWTLKGSRTVFQSHHFSGVLMLNFGACFDTCRIYVQLSGIDRGRSRRSIHFESTKAFGCDSKGFWIPYTPPRSWEHNYPESHDGIGRRSAFLLGPGPFFRDKLS